MPQDRHRIQLSLSNKLALIMVAGQVLFGLSVFWSQYDPQTEVGRQALTIAFEASVLSSIFSALIYVFVQRSYVNPLLVITRDLNHFRPDEKFSKLKMRRSRSGLDELDLLVEHVNSLKERMSLSHWALSEMNAELERRVEERARVILEQRQKLEASAHWSALGEMAGSIAHEINNPLAIIMGKAQILLRKNPPDEMKPGLDGIVRTTGRIAEVVNSLRVLSRDASQDTFEYVTPSVILNDALGLSSERLRKRGIEIKKGSGMQNWEICCRRVQIAQILVNLINNSIDAIEGYDGGWIEFDLVPSHGNLVFQVRDSGKGFAPEIRPKVLTPFFTTKEIGKGTGLGLSLSRSIMVHHRGSLNIDFNASHTTIQLTFPEFRVLQEGSRAAS